MKVGWLQDVLDAQLFDLSRVNLVINIWLCRHLAWLRYFGLQGSALLPL